TMAARMPCMFEVLTNFTSLLGSRPCFETSSRPAISVLLPLAVTAISLPLSSSTDLTAGGACSSNSGDAVVSMIASRSVPAARPLRTSAPPTLPTCTSPAIIACDCLVPSRFGCSVASRPYFANNPLSMAIHTDEKTTLVTPVAVTILTLVPEGIGAMAEAAAEADAAGLAEADSAAGLAEAEAAVEGFAAALAGAGALEAGAAEPPHGASVGAISPMNFFIDSSPATSLCAVHQFARPLESNRPLPRIVGRQVLPRTVSSVRGVCAALRASFQRICRAERRSQRSRLLRSRSYLPGLGPEATRAAHGDFSALGSGDDKGRARGAS